MHVAQLNVGRLRAPIDDPMIHDFRSNLAAINALAEASPGYVWRLQYASGDATSIHVFDSPIPATRPHLPGSLAGPRPSP